MEQNKEASGPTKKCPKCGEEIQSSAKKCKHCQADLRNWFAKHKFATGILIIFVLVIVMAANSDKKDNSSAPTAPDSSQTKAADNTQATPADNSQAAPKTAKIGDTVSDGDLAFTVQDMKTAATVGNSFSKKTAQGLYYILSVKIQNNGKETKTINASDFKITDSQGRKYDYSQDGQTAVELGEGTTDLFLQQVQPGLGVNGSIVFDIPKDDTGLKLLAQGDLFSHGVTVDLGK